MITVKTTIHSSMELVWAAWTSAEHITQWTFASDDWHAPYAEIDLKVGGRFKTTMAAKDESFSFEAKSAADAASEVVQKWETLMWKYQQAMPGAKPGEKWVFLEKIFTLPQ